MRALRRAVPRGHGDVSALRRRAVVGGAPSRGDAGEGAEEGAALCGDGRGAGAARRGGDRVAAVRAGRRRGARATRRRGERRRADGDDADAEATRRKGEGGDGGAARASRPTAAMPVDAIGESTPVPNARRGARAPARRIDGGRHGARGRGGDAGDRLLARRAVDSARRASARSRTTRRAGVGQKRAPVQQLDDEDKPTKKRATTQP